MGGNPDKAARLFGNEGFIHVKAKQDRTIAPVQGTEQLKHKQFQGFLQEELKAIHAALRAEKLLRPDCEAVMHDALREGMRQRMERDAPFRAIVQKAAKEGKYLLHFDSSAASDMGGKRLPNGTIQGNNRVGKTIMEIAGIPY